MCSYELRDGEILVALLQQALGPQIEAHRKFSEAVEKRTDVVSESSWGDESEAAKWTTLAASVTALHNTVVENNEVVRSMVTLSEKYDIALVRHFLLEGFLDVEQISRAISSGIDAAMLKSITATAE